ncbi:MAG: ATP-binding protein, partial [Tepidisphaeraceae bacterium]
MERETLFDRGGEMALRMAALDWAGTALGPPAQWPHSLRAVVRVMLTSRYAMWMAWGPSLTFFCNDAYLPTLGVKQEWALGSPANEVWAEIWPDIGPRIDRVLQTGEATRDEALRLILKRSGYSEETYHTFSYSPLADDAGRVSGMLCVVTEETERVIGERRLGALRDLAARLAASSGEAEVCRAISLSLAGASHDLPFAAVYLADADGAYRLAAQAGLPTMHGAFPEVVHTGDAPWPLDDVMRTGGSPRSIDDLASRWPDLPSGPWPEPPSRAVLLPIPQQGKARPAGVFIAAVNPFRPLDEAYGSFLGLVAGQISASLSNARAYEAERQRAEALAEIDRAKTTFFSNVSHEFRTPLTLMLGPLLDTITQRNGSLPPQVMEELTVVHRNGLRLLKLVNTLLDFSRIEAGRVQVSFEWTDLAGYTRDLASLFRSAIEKAGLTLEVDIPTIAMPALVDRDMWEKIVLNLISNAFKFTLRGGIRVSLREVRDAFVLMVQDTGCGISAEELPRVFDRFHRVAGTQGRTHEGTGIGLALVQELVKMHEGSVVAESEPGRGSTFYVTIPRRSEQAATPLPAGEAIPERSARSNAYVEEALRWLPDGEMPASESLDDATGIEESRPAGVARDVVLIADDNADMRDYLRRLLAKQYDVITAADGAEALCEAVRRRPALILSDVMMPKLDGFGLLQAVRAEPALSAVSILLLSARAGEEATLEGIRAGADDYLVKPFSARELLTRVEAQIQRKRFEAQLAAAERTLRSTLAAAQMAAWTWDPQTDDVSLSETAAEVFGLQPGQSIRTGSDGLSLLLPQDIARHQMIVGRAIEQNDAFTSEFRIVRPLDGKIAWLEQRGQVFRDASTGQSRVTGLVADVTQRKLAELALQASKERANFFVTLDDALRSITDPSEMSWEA